MTGSVGNSAKGVESIPRGGRESSMDANSEFRRFYSNGATLGQVGSFYGLTCEEMGRALHYARLSKTMNSAAHQEQQRKAAERVTRAALAKERAANCPIDQAWCAQCERRVYTHEAAACESQWCKAKAAAA